MAAISRLVVTYLVNASWQIIAIAVMGLLCSALIKRMPAKYRHVLWVACLGACVGAPLATVLYQSGDSGDIRSAMNAAPAVSDFRQPGHGSAFRLQMRSRAVGLPANLAPLLTWSYAAFLLFRLGFLGWNYRRTVQIRSKAYRQAMPPSLGRVWAHCTREIARGAIQALCSPEISSPATLGYRKPVVVLPGHFFDGEVCEQELMAALGHELAHIRRRDFALNMLSEVATLPICFHPAVVLIRARIAQTRELACDEMAATLLPSPTQYARSLLRLAQTTCAAAQAAETSYALGLFDTHALEERIMNILKTGNNSERWVRTRTVLAVSVVTLMSLAICGFSVRVVDHASAEARRFVGTWETQYKGHAFFTLKLKEENGGLGGSCVHVTRVAWVDGDLIPGTEETSEERITDARISGPKVSLRIGDSDPILLEFTLTNDHEAEGKPIVDPDGNPPPPKKPWHFQRISSAP